MATKRVELQNADGCFNRAAEDEPIFVLRANDELAASVVRVWADYYRTRKRAIHGSLSPQQNAKYQEALKLAQEMDDWRIQRDIEAAFARSKS